MDQLIQMGKDLGYESEKLQDFVKQQQEKETADKLAERADKLAMQQKDREIELARIAAQEKERADKLATQEKKIGKSS